MLHQCLRQIPVHMLKVGITGGIGSGKTSVCMIFEAIGIPVYYADIQAKLLMDTDPALKASLEECFGKDIYHNGLLDRRKMANIIFNERLALEKVNSLVHPAVNCDFEYWCNQQVSSYVLEESAILFETNMTQRFEKIILVTAPTPLRIERVCLRDRITAEAVRKRMASQWQEEKKIPLADYIIYNDNEHFITPQVRKIHRQLLLISK